MHSYLLFIQSSFYQHCRSFFLDPAAPLPIVSVKNSVKDLLSFLRDSHFLQMKQLTDLWAADYPSDKLRFQVNYYLLTLRYNFRLLIRQATPYHNKVLPSVSDLYPSALWLEREVYDLYGVFFHGHPDLRRILTDYGFQGHPLRKDFPLSGYTQLRYDDELKQIVSEPVNFSQEYRYFDFLSPWR
jgi:NADH-quinone oxidoreductase subunit C